MSSYHEMTTYDSRDADFWSDVPAHGNGSAPAPGRPAVPKQPNPLDKVRRLLRGRTTLALVLALGGALIGAALGWMSESPVYQAYGNVRVEPYVPAFQGNSEAVPAYRQFMFSEAKLMQRLPMATRAMEEPVWKEAVGENSWPPAVFAASTQVRHTADDSYLHVEFRHADPDIAEAGATALIEAYADFFHERQAQVDTQKIEMLQARETTLREEIAEMQDEIDRQSEFYGGVADLRSKTDGLMKEQQQVRDELRGVRRDLQIALEARQAVQERPLPMADLARGDSDLALMLRDLEGLKRERVRLVNDGKGAIHGEVVALTSQIESLQSMVDAHADAVRSYYFGEIPNLNGGGTIPLTASFITALETLQRDREQRLSAIDENLARVARDEQTLTELNRLLKLRREDLLATQKAIENEQANSAFQAQMASINTYVPPEGSAGVWRDKRNVMALGGAIFGFALPMGVVLLLGLLDSRFRYSEDAAEAGERITLLGILPNLPDRLSDPNQASIAAHCVHQIRTILQINHGSDDSRAFAVTSASRGDGKTSLALALGLSYAASGARTLLIDTDLQHGGLSSRLGVGGDEGIMDALTGGELLQYVCETDVTDLAILPIGRAAGNHAGAFSPAAVRHMLEQAKRHFDVIICDTGPILGSIEATPIAAAVDGVVLTVSRGQSRPLVSKALGHLESVGATVAGLVFNRAQASDFERSVSGMNLRNGSARGLARSGARGTLTNGSVLSSN